jgi:putative transposase
VTRGVILRALNIQSLLKELVQGLVWTARQSVLDNAITERLWRTLKYEEVYINDYDSPREARWGISQYFEKYNNRRLHQSLGYKTPAEVYFM